MLLFFLKQFLLGEFEVQFGSLNLGVAGVIRGWVLVEDAVVCV